MSHHDFDLFLIGGGSAGVRCARMAAGLGARVALVEERHMGGTCVHVGCVPKKLFSYGAHYSEAFADAQGFGWSAEPPRLDWARLVSNKRRELARLEGIYGTLLRDAGVEVFRGRGTVTGPHEVQVGDRTLSAERIVIATGGWPWVPDIPGTEHSVTSNEIFDLPECPAHLVIIGGGYIAVELASIFRGFGTQVDLIYRGPLFLRGFDVDLREHLATELRARGIRLHFDTNCREVERADDGRHLVHLTRGEPLPADQVLFAVGRRPLTRGLGLEALGVAMNDRGAIRVDAAYQTSVPSIYGLGDALDRFNLTPVALAEGTWLAHHLFGDPRQAVSYDNIPTTIFTNPNLATVGMSETVAKQKLDRVRIYRSTFRPMRHTMSGRRTKTLMKLVVCHDTDRVIGAHMIGPDAGEIIQGLAIAINCGATKAKLDTTIGIHPTAAEEFVTMRTPAEVWSR